MSAKAIAVSEPVHPKILNLMQFARKAGKLVAGSDACLRAMHHKHIHLIVIASDTAERSKARITAELQHSQRQFEVICIGTQAELSAALGLPITGVFGISDQNFASSILKYWQA
ncbi:MAG TPA: ribosomal L7Ae/L30e/S12e/Gadd45 family protein [Candidatus Cloacimonadota bacterium]|nr:ribosomal L7Ae/L30e/S12e/Gadd45 family protein [Candidatus Cloacimonadota bacterium]